MYEALLTVHVLAAIIWIGGGFALHALALRAAPAERGVLVPHMSWYGDKVLGAAAGVLLLVGIAMVIDADHIDFGDTWIIIALAGWALSSFLGAVVIARVGKELGALAAAPEPDFGAIEAKYRKLINLSRLDLVIVTIVVIDMVTKPGV